MALINFQQKEIVVKVVYYGPAFSGKTTNVRKLHDQIPGKLVGNLAALDTDDERTLFFDYFPIKAGAIGRYKLKIQIYSVPGQAYYRSTRKMVLQNADGVIFVADSQASEIEHNIVAFSDLEENLRSYGVDMESFPIVIQYNKRDLKNVLPTEFLDRKLNLRGYPYTEAVSVEGKGVLEAFNGIVELVTRRLRNELSRTEKGLPLDGEFFQPLGGEHDDEAAVKDLVHRIADLGEHGEHDLKEALTAVGETPVETGSPHKVALHWMTNSLEFNLQSIDEPAPGRLRVYLKGGGEQSVQIWLSRSQLETLLPAPPPAPAPPPGSPNNNLVPFLFLWLAALTVTMLLLFV
jgi:signal recognition particle receptor subunit beta